MDMTKAWRISSFLIAATSAGMLFGCANYEVNTKRGDIPGHYIRYEMQEADRAVEAARLAGKDKTCPAEFKAAEDAKNHAYDVFRACHTEEGAALAKQATALANALCPPQTTREVTPQPEEAAILAVPAAEPTPERMKYCVSLDIEFDINRADIRPQYHDEVAKVGEFMKRNPTTTATIEGYADEVGSADYNMQLSQRRAESVVKSLTNDFGIDPSRLSAKGYGKAKPIADNATDAGKQKNRRIEAIIDCALDVKDLAQPAERLCMTLKMEFATDSAEIKPGYYGEIDGVGEYMKKYPTTTAVIEGHTDNVGAQDYNMQLSRQRAENVVNYLADKHGIERSRLSAKGYGSTRAIAYNTSPEGRQKNRRINAIIDCVIKK
ncbi:OmpA family protein [Oryzomonas japonica]|uniref:OmpA family protein n=2 Tax=Oryzomonas japonica TaxID=2603858 RepID=A0A7J4ZM72_9BACT|nr:OmpA family protein [Oryzomonas japonica]